MTGQVRAEPVRFEEAFRNGDNALNFIRLCLALLVIVGHTMPITGVDDLPNWFIGLGGWAVDGFFIISGYLIVGSRIRSSWWPFLARRFARIYPGFLFAIVVTALLFAPLAAGLGGGTWSPHGAADYIVGNLSIFHVQYLMDGITFPAFQAWNGSSWTLRYELFSYLACFVVFSIPFVRRHILPVSIATWVVLTAFWITARPILDVTTNDYVNMARLGSFFAAGALAYALRSRITARWRYAIVAGCLVVPLYLLGESGEKLAHLPLTYLVLALGALLPTRLGSRNDISYGVYIFAFPIQQMMAFLDVQRFGGYAHMAASIAVTLVFAAVSWFLIERPSMTGTRLLIARTRRRPQQAPSPGESVPTD